MTATVRLVTHRHGREAAKMATTEGQQQLLVSIPDACTRLGGIGRTSVYDLINQSLLVKVNIGRRGFITAKSLEAYVDRLSDAAQESAALA